VKEQPARLTETMVHTAMRELVAEGLEPKYSAVRERLASGSNSTIVKYMSTYDPEAWDGPNKTPKPPEDATNAIWQIAYRLAWRVPSEDRQSAVERAEEISHQAEALAVALYDLEREQNGMKQELHAANAAWDKASLELADMKGRYTALEQKHERTKEELDAANTAKVEATWELADMKKKHERTKEELDAANAAKDKATWELAEMRGHYDALQERAQDYLDRLTAGSNPNGN
jgi:hypothetical protein